MGGSSWIRRSVLLRDVGVAPTARMKLDLNGDGIVDFADYLEFLTLFEALDPRVDFNEDGVIDFLDYLEFLNYFGM